MNRTIRRAFAYLNRGLKITKNFCCCCCCPNMHGISSFECAACTSSRNITILVVLWNKYAINVVVVFFTLKFNAWHEYSFTILIQLLLCIKLHTKHRCTDFQMMPSITTTRQIDQSKTISSLPRKYLFFSFLFFLQFYLYLWLLGIGVNVSRCCDCCRK